MKKVFCIICLCLSLVMCRTTPKTVFYDIKNKTILIKEDTKVIIIHMKEGTTLEINPVKKEDSIQAIDK